MGNTAYILEDAGFTREQVDALTTQWDGATATKADISDLRGELKADIERLNGKIDHVATELNGKIETTAAELRGDIKELRSDLRVNFRYVIGIGAVIGGVILIEFVRGLLP